jgi:hypothetical protein
MTYSSKTLKPNKYLQQLCTEYLCEGNCGIRMDVRPLPSEVVALLHLEGDVDLLGPHWHAHCLTVLNTCWHRHLEKNKDL